MEVVAIPEGEGGDFGTQGARGGRETERERDRERERQRERERRRSIQELWQPQDYGISQIYGYLGARETEDS